MDRRVHNQGDIRAKAIVGMLLAASTAIIAGVYLHNRPAPEPVASTQPATATSPATAPRPAPPPDPPAVTWMDVVHRNNKSVATTQPLNFPVDLRDAARLIVADPVYLCPRGDLWVTRADAEPTPGIIKNAARQQVHVLREQVLFVQWNFTGGGASPVLVVREGDNLIRLDRNGREPIPFRRQYDWARAFTWLDKVLVPAGDGASVIDLHALTETHVPLPSSEASAADPSPIRIVLDPRGVLAWRVNGPAARFLDGKWSPLNDPAAWPPRVVELIPMLDGSVVQLLRAPRPAAGLDAAMQESIELASTSLALGIDASAAVDEPAILKLVGQLSDDDAKLRDAASAELSRYGPAIWSILSRERPRQPLEGQGRIDELLASQARPKLGRLSPVSDDLQTAGYLRDGGVVLYSSAGVEVGRGGNETRLEAPAWIAIRPGRSVRLLPPRLVADAQPGKTRFEAWGDEWIVNDDLSGPRRNMGNHLMPLINEDLRRFDTFQGIDARGRWLLRDTQTSETLVIDPFIADETPRLPVWSITVAEGATGWNDQDWPVQKSGGAWALAEDRWQVMKDDEPMRTYVIEDAPATTPAETVLLTEADGTTWFDGETHLRFRRGEVGTDYELPPEALGSGHATLIRAAGRLFLFNSPGRVLRFRETPGSSEPLKLEAVFTQGVPLTDEPARIWLDPAGRIVMAYGQNKLAIMFPEGRVPPSNAKMMPAEQE